MNLKEIIGRLFAEARKTNAEMGKWLAESKNVMFLNKKPMKCTYCERKCNKYPNDVTCAKEPVS